MFSPLESTLSFTQGLWENFGPIFGNVNIRKKIPKHLENIPQKAPNDLMQNAIFHLTAHLIVHQALGMIGSRKTAGWRGWGEEVTNTKLFGFWPLPYTAQEFFFVKFNWFGKTRGFTFTHWPPPPGSAIGLREGNWDGKLEMAKALNHFL